MSSQLGKVTGYLIEKTERAYHIEAQPEGERIWIPRSLCTYTRKTGLDTINIEVHVELWFLKKAQRNEDFKAWEEL